jgi:copper(I)-binding protein
MGMFNRISASLLLLAGPLLLSACADPIPLYVDSAWIRPSANPETPSAGYFTVHGGPVDVELRGVIADRVQRIEIHESGSEGGMATMKPVDAVKIPAKTVVVFAPGGKHLMMFGVNAREAIDGNIPLTFIFSNGDRIIANAVLQKTGDAAPAPKADAKKP